ncbi:General odorant-binding protein 83a [Frankliniella fusca]|uniref:General odorant-binding protein 83a n=1 Tax=Frankliniella fusca TaxID=407009 RepID=A0AAE1H7L4_9NEOP|nr:General odorant-binding protein 83a [Frankliniella fusca]
MKSVAVAVLCFHLVLAASTSSGDDSMKADFDACMQETGATYEEGRAWADGADASENLKCQMKCVMLKAKKMTEDGHLVLEPMLESAPQEMHEVIRQCVQIDQGGDLCDLGYRHQKCIREKAPEAYAEMVKKNFGAIN